ncbi:hypothetical protein GCM10027445_10610 [Amycolatopsis endophytica]
MVSDGGYSHVGAPQDRPDILIEAMRDSRDLPAAHVPPAILRRTARYRDTLDLADDATVDRQHLPPRRPVTAPPRQHRQRPAPPATDGTRRDPPDHRRAPSATTPHTSYRAMCSDPERQGPTTVRDRS